MLGDLSRRDWIVLSVVWSAAFALAVMMLFRGGLSGAGLAFIGLVAFGGALFFSALAERRAQGAPQQTAPAEREPQQTAPAEREPARPAPARAEAAKEAAPAKSAGAVAPAPKPTAAPAPKPAAQYAPKPAAEYAPKPAAAPAPTSAIAPAPEPAAAPASEGDRPALLPAPREGGADDLKQIKGVGPKLEALLNRMGVHHFDQIAAWTPREVAWVDDNLEGFRGRVTRDGWVDQARILAGGGETAFSARVAQGEVPTSRA